MLYCIFLSYKVEAILRHLKAIIMNVRASGMPVIIKIKSPINDKIFSVFVGLKNGSYGSYIHL
jgi:hypothetical protein